MGVAAMFSEMGRYVASEIARQVTSQRNVSSQLLLLVVRPMFRGGETAVSIELNVGGAGQDEQRDATQLPWELPYAAFQPADPVPARELIDVPLGIPKELTSGLLYRLAEHQISPSKPLWLKLARPYGLLGTAPWERELGAALGRPILRIPDFPDRPVERADVLESALVVDDAADVAPADVARRAREVAQAVLKGSSRPTTRVNVFASARFHPALADLAKDKRICVHDPADATLSAASSEALREPSNVPLRSQAWVDWVLGSIGSRCLDAVHVVTRAKWSEGTGYLMVAGSPSGGGAQSPLALVDLDEFGLLLNRVGAWAATFTPPSPGCAKDVAFVADRFAHLRPGAVLFNPGEGPGNLEPLHAACKVLFSAKPSPAPALGDAFLHCHPDSIRGEEQPDAGQLLATLADNARNLVERSPLGERLSQAVTKFIPGVPTTELSGPPAWVAAMQRFLETAALNAARRDGNDSLLSNVRPGASEDHRKLPVLSEQTVTTLAAIQDVLVKYTNKTES